MPSPLRQLDWRADGSSCDPESAPWANQPAGSLGAFSNGIARGHFPLLAETRPLEGKPGLGAHKGLGAPNGRPLARLLLVSGDRRDPAADSLLCQRASLRSERELALFKLAPPTVTVTVQTARSS